jgi:hypothetical protein
MGFITSAVAAAAVSAAAQTGPEAPDTVVVQPTYITAAARLAPAAGSPVTTHTNAYARGEAVAREKPELAVVTIRGLTPWEPRVDVTINPWVRQDGPIYDDFREFGANDGPYLGTNPGTRAIEKTQERLERARQQWLRDNGWVGGVATFVNPGPDTLGDEATEAPKPRATIRMPAGSSGGGNFRVEADREGSAARDALARIEARRQTLAQAAREQRDIQAASAEATPAAVETAEEGSAEARTAHADEQR